MNYLGAITNKAPCNRGVAADGNQDHR